MVVSPAGLQRGLESSTQPRLWYTKAALPSWSWLWNLERNTVLAERADWMRIMDRRAAIHTHLGTSDGIAGLCGWLTEGSAVAGDLLGGIAGTESSPRCEQSWRRTPRVLLLCPASRFVTLWLATRYLRSTYSRTPSDFWTRARNGGRWTFAALRACWRFVRFPPQYGYFYCCGKRIRKLLAATQEDFDADALAPAFAGDPGGPSVFRTPRVQGSSRALGGSRPGIALRRRSSRTRPNARAVSGSRLLDRTRVQCCTRPAGIGRGGVSFHTGYERDCTSSHCCNSAARQVTEF
jgi:hypothetical protein